MLLADWHFCCRIRLQPGDTRAYLSLMEVLRSPRSRPDLLDLAAGQVTALEPIQQAYAIPALVGAARRTTHAETAGRLTTALIAAVGPDAPPALVHLLTRLGSATHGDIIEALSALPPAAAAATAPATAPYLDLPDRTAEVATLSLLRSAAARIPHTVDSFVEQRADLFDPALDGLWGRLPHLIALETAAAVGSDVEHPGEKGRRLTGRILGVTGVDGLAQPDVLETMARLWFIDGTAEDIEREAVGFQRLDRLHAELGGSAGDEAYAWLRARPERLFGRMLWQTTLWLIATERDPAGTTKLLERWWGAPPSAAGRVGKGTPMRVWLPCHPPELPRARTALEELIRLRLKPHLKQVSVELNVGAYDRMQPLTGSLLYSPWLHRLDATFHPMAPRDQAVDQRRKRRSVTEGTFPHLGDKAALLRLFGALAVAESLLGAAGAQPPAYLIDLFLHSADVLSSHRLRQHLGNFLGATPTDDDPPLLNGPMTGLALYARELTNRIGSGSDSSALPPTAVAARLRDTVRHQAGERGMSLVGSYPLQQVNLLQEAATMVASHWAYEAYSGLVDVPLKAASSSWYAEQGGPSPAEQVLALAMEEMWRYDPQSAAIRLQEPATLAMEHFPRLFAQVDRTEWNWLARLADGRAVNARQVLLAEVPAVDDWTEVSIPEPNPKVTTDLAMLTVRLEALLIARAGGERTDWVRAWRDRLLSVNHRHDLPRDIRRRMLDLLDLEPDEDDDAVLLQVQEMVVDAVAEFSKAAPRYLDRLAAKLSGELPIGPSTTAALRVRLFRAMLGGDDHESPGGPWERHAQLIAAAQRTQLLERFVAVAGGLTARPWEWLRAAESLVAAAVPGEQVDPRLLAAAFPRGYELARVPLNVSLRRFGYHHDQRDATNLFSVDAPRDKRLPAGRVWLSGIVAGTDDDRRRVLVNVGLGTRPYTLASRLRTEVGDLVAVRVNDGAAESVELLHQRPPAGGEVRRASFTVRPLGVTVTVDGYRNLRIDYQTRGSFTPLPVVLDHWDPDVSGWFRDGAPGEISGTTMVRWDDESQVWLPADRCFAHFVSAELGAGETTVILIERAVTPHGDAWRVATRPGDVYLLPPTAWTPTARDQLTQWRIDQRQRGDVEGTGGRTDENGLLIHVRLGTTGTGSPLLELADRAPAASHERWRDLADGPFDDRNLRWRQLFDDSDTHIATWSDVDWVMATGVPQIAETVAVQVRHPGGMASSMAFELWADGWNDACRRRGQARGRVVGRKSLHDSERPGDRFAALRYVREGDVFAIKPLSVKDGSFSSVRGYTVDDLPVEIDFDSLTMDSTLTKGLSSERVVVVRSIRTKRAEHVQDPVRVDTVVLERHLHGPDRGRIARLEERGNGVAGLVAWVVPHHEDHDACGVWLEDDRGAFSCTVPRSAFSAPPRRQGDLVWASWQPGGWTFEASTRLINVRALWRAVPTPQGRVPDSALHLGAGIVPPGGLRELIQRTDRAEVIVAAPGGTTRPHLDEMSGRGRKQVPTGVGRVEWLWDFPDGGGWVSRVRLKVSDRRYLYGQALSGSFGRGGDSWSGMQIFVDEYETGDGRTLLDIRRRFLPGRGMTRAVPARTDDDQRLRERFGHWLQKGDRHATGTLRPGVAELDGLRVPLAAGGWTADVPIPTTDTPWVPGRNDYGTAGSRFLLDEDPVTGQWHGSYRHAEPLTVERFARRLGWSSSRADVGPIKHTLFFAGLDEAGNYRFEFGYGWTVLAPADRVRIGTQPAPSLFFGDRVKAVSFERAEAVAAGEQLVLVIAPDDVQWEIEHELWAGDRTALQLVTVLIHPQDTDVTVESVTSTRTTPTQPLSADVRERRLHNARFDRASLEQIIAALPEELRDSARPVRRTIIVEVDRAPDAEPSTERPYLTLWFLTPAGEAAGGRGLRKGHRILMERRHIERSGGGRFQNDIIVAFSLDGVLGQDNEPVEVRVFRRSFSYREATLRRALEKQQRKEPVGLPVRMWVTIGRSIDPGVWMGSTVDAPARKSDTLREWLATTPGAVFATVVEVLRTGVVVELSPGVIGQIDVAEGVARRLRERDIVSLRWTGSRIFVATAVSADTSFARKARPATLLPMDNMLKRPQEFQRDNGMFTVVSLPNLAVAGGEHTDAVMRCRHPKLAMIALDGQQAKIVGGPEEVRAATVSAGEEDQPKLGTVAPDGPPPPDAAGWHRLSFADRPAQDVARHCRRGRWEYHDLTTGTWAPGRDDQIVSRSFELPVPARPSNAPLFFDGRWSLRYRPVDLERFAYPAIPLLEDRNLGRERTFPVAGVLQDGQGIWLELAPGRVVEVPGSILHAPGAATGLERFRWRDMAPGDEVTVRSVAASPVALNPLDLVEWQPGPRGFLGNRRALLLVTGQDPDKGSLSLAGGEWRLTYPAGWELRSQLPPGSYCWLDRDNELTPMRDGDVPEPGDVLLATWRSDRWAVAGLDGLRCELALDTAGWLSEALARDDERAMILDAVGGYLPVRVTECDATPVRMIPAGLSETPSAHGQILQVRVLGELADGAVLTRHGRTLLRVELKALLPGVPRRLAADVIAWMRRSRERTAVWMRVDRGRLMAGAGPAAAQGTETTVEPLTAIGDHGVVCRETRSLSLRWLPARQCSWANGLTTSALHSAVSGEESLTVVVREDATISATMTAAARHHWNRLSPGSSVRAMPVAALNAADDLHHRYLVRLYPDGWLAELVSENHHQVGPDTEPLPMLVIERSAPERALRLVEKGMQRTRLDVCTWMAESLGGAPVPARFAAYADAETDEDLGVAVVRAYRRGEGAAAALLPWLEAGDGATELDVAPALAAVLLLRQLGKEEKTRLAARHAVRLARRVGACAARSLHLAPIARMLHARACGESPVGPEVRFAAIDLGGLDTAGRPDPRFAGSLRESQANDLRAFCRGVIGRSRSQAAQRHIVALAAGLLAALGDTTHTGLLVEPQHRDATLWPLAALGRALSPNPGDFVAQPHLEDMQVRLLQQLLTAILADRVPISMIVMPQDSPDEREIKENHRLLDLLRQG